MNTNRYHDPQTRRTHLVWRWLARRRNLMMTSALRGTCYGIGAGIVGLVFWWWEQNL